MVKVGENVLMYGSETGSRGSDGPDATLNWCFHRRLLLFCRSLLPQSTCGATSEHESVCDDHM